MLSISEILAEGRKHYNITGCETSTHELGPNGTIVSVKVWIGDKVSNGSELLLTPASPPLEITHVEMGDAVLGLMKAIWTTAEVSALTQALERAGVYENQTFILPQATIEVGTQEYKPVPGTGIEEESGGLCSDCGKDIWGYWAGVSRLSGIKVAELTEERHGRPLCASCSRKLVKAKVKR